MRDARRLTRHGTVFYRKNNTSQRCLPGLKTADINSPNFRDEPIFPVARVGSEDARLGESGYGFVSGQLLAFDANRPIPHLRNLSPTKMRP